MSSTFGTYQRVFMLGIDGMGAFCRQTPTPHMDRLFENGAVSYTVLASRPTISAQRWTSMLTGATPAVHQLTNSNMCPIDSLPTIFRLVRNAYPHAESAAFTDWSPIAREIISPSGGADTLDTGHADELVERLLDYLDAQDPKLLFASWRKAACGALAAAQARLGRCPKPRKGFHPLTHPASRVQTADLLSQC